VQPNEVSSRRRLGYNIVALLLVLWLALTLAHVIVHEPQIWWFTYFSVDYRLGFVRRGLAGEILDFFPAHLYFTGLLTLRWLVSTLFIIGLAAVAWTVAVKFGRSERRLMLALLIPVLPFGFAAAIYAPHPDLLAGAALAAFAATLASVKEDRTILSASACYGFTTALLTLIHEAIPLLYSLGAIVAIVALGMHSPIKVQRLSALLAVVPGLVVGLAIGFFGRRGVSSQLCARVPHRAVNWPPAGQQASHQMARGQAFYVDYHDFVCRNVITKFDQTPADGAREIARVGAVPLTISMVFGIVVFTVTILAINRISGVPFRRFCHVLRGRLVWVTLAALLLLTVFTTATDWSRWWVRISFDVGMVYLLYASGQPEAAQPPTRRTRVIFAVGIILFACYPIGALPSLGMPPLV
jgi:hypothetical protein